ncbi:hypothetical protein [Clostridium butyricum]|uniref:hypothetical protein n=1 Tax=Clostridium butyricum TaxID=1492 RepID=UPI002AB1AC2B|nr:hypothetical protein [Clostridium butyricum]
MKRSKCETSSRHTILLNTLNPKEKVIYDFLQAQYNKSEVIKDILFNYINDNNLHDDNKVISNLSHNDNKMISKLSSCDNKMISNSVTNSNQEENRSFDINLDSIEDKEIDMEKPIEADDAINNAMNFMLNM